MTAEAAAPLEKAVPDSKLIECPKTLIYADPPYMMETRKGGDLYRHEMNTQEHQLFLETVIDASCMVMISGYRSPLYDAMLQKWRRIDYLAQTRSGFVPESHLDEFFRTK